ncbi:hypothetical protein K493DRAFT_315841 [Basidiobolus meristosporus CBS 931.73]|uniref:SNARE-complex protein Syntaxin-18 N-terminal domain-containing protein n=1 Tax=Basidiobolus meristosporus CBS 931.73 TaxID=1314790 RepID=A0A1Y1Y830_9FUNG|nr:hypothetical protein K493DRAFT_315841 [Basidiobolus meristosporus CBS 931.73]|eukprot:ORX93734.1 hypothetical protein K493DRAFT_315841 [Basidiobolus meristosporus CBS 931.73]
MPDLTNAFRDSVKELSSSQQLKNELRKRRGSGDKQASQAKPHDEFIKEAYRVANHIVSLKNFLFSVRRAYLNFSRTTAVQTQFPTQNQTFSELNLSLPSGASLTNKQRDEIDMQAKMIIQNCISRITSLENVEKVRQSQIKANPLNSFSKIFTTTSDLAQEILTTHRSGILWLLNKRLMDVSTIQREHQEARLTREMERQRSPINQQIKNLGTSSTFPDFTAHGDDEGKAALEESASEDEFEPQLSAQEKMVLEMENEALVKDLESSLDEVKKVEQTLLEIATLQNTLSTHLAIQAKETERLQSEAIATTERIRDGNVMLAQARQRHSDLRKWILFFLIMVSGVLLFLDWYD